jgi:hypothetical protein
MAAPPRHWFLALLLAPALAFAQGDDFVPDLTLQRPIVRPLSGAASTKLANSNCAQSTCDTVWVGHSNAGPGGAFLGVGIGGVWDFDTGIAGTDSSQGWVRHNYQYTSDIDKTAARLSNGHDYGNMINKGNTALWHARDLAGRAYVKVGCVSAWHPDDMAGVKKKLNDGAEPSSVPLSGARSAWCGLRTSGDTHAQDPLTGNYINGDLYNAVIGNYVGSNPDFPGFCSQWDQLLYKDFPSTGTGTVEFRVRTDMSNFVDTTSGGTGWYNPDPTSPSNFVLNPADSFMVYVGSPNDNAYDTNRRWFSEVLDFSKPVQELFSVSSKYPFVTADTLINRAYAGAQPIGGVIRVVFRVKTNRVRADGIVGTATGYNSKDGAALVDQVRIDGGSAYGFESVGDITARELIADLAAPNSPWAATGRAWDSDFHIENVSNLIYEDLCGAVGAPGRQCNLAGCVVVAGDHDDAERLTSYSYQGFESPTIDLAVRTMPPGTKNAQGIDQATASRTEVHIQYDIYTGFMGLDESIFWYTGSRFYGPASVQPQSGNRCWSPTQIVGLIKYRDDPTCITMDESLNNIPAGSIDSLRLKLATISLAGRFGGTNLGNTRGTYFDNVRAGFVRPSTAVVPLAQGFVDKYQDQFPWNEAVTPGDNAAFDTTTALVHTGLNIVAPATAAGVVAGDSITCTAPFSGNGVSTGTRVDLVFRIDPGPGNYVTKGNRASALVNLDPAHPFFASYLADNGAFGTPGGHAGGTWNRNVWNSARMDTAEANVYPIQSRGIGGPYADTWMGTLHEQDPRYAALGVVHNVCFLIDPNGTTDNSNITCSGSPPIPYGAVSGTTREGTKILPDGWFTPGTHVEYFLRRSALESPGTAILMFDTTRVTNQGGAGNEDLDLERWSNFDVLPDMWKSTRYGGGGLACMLVIDDADRRGADPAVRGALDTLLYGKNNGATSGWKGLGPNSDPDDPAGFVAANLGQYGVSYDHYDIRGAESAEAGHPGVRLANNPGAIANKRDTSGPSQAMLGALYSTIAWSSGDLDHGTIHDAFDAQESANDILLLSNFLAGATPPNRRGLFLSGDGIAEDAFKISDNGTHLAPFLQNTFGAQLSNANYLAHVNTAEGTFAAFPTAPWAHPGRVYGMALTCTSPSDILAIAPAVDGASEAMQYQNLGTSPWTASIYRPTATGRDYRTRFDGFDLSHLRGNYANVGQIATVAGTDFARLYWLDDVLSGHFQVCGRRGWIGLGDLPGSSPAVFANANLGSYPNPSFAGSRVSLRFTLAQAQAVTLRIFDVAGREVARIPFKGLEGPNVATWDGTLANGARASAGVYFYALDGVPGEPKTSKLILLSAR